MKRVTGLGGIFFNSKDPDAIRKWYNDHLGIQAEQWGTSFEWRYAEEPDKKGSTAWSVMREGSDYFKPSTKDFMINYRVENLVALVEELKKEDVEIVDDVQNSEYGKFVHILDPEGNKIELWEPAED